MSKKLIKSGLVVSVMTLASRVLGLVRDIVIAHLLGAGTAADVFFFANRIPNFLRRLFAEGAFNQAFVPVMTEYQRKHGDDEVRELFSRVAGTLGMLVGVVTIIGMIASPVVSMIFGTGWFLDYLRGGPEAEKFVLASDILRVTFPYLLFITLTAMSGAILNTRGKFAVPALTPIFLNLALIAAALWLAPHMENPEFGLAIGMVSGGVLQFVFQLPFLKRQGLLVLPKWGWNHPGVARIRKLMIPALFGVSVSQVNLLFDTFLASFLATGSISYLYYSDRLLQFPLGLFGIAIATVILPALSRRHVDQSSKQFDQTMDWGVRMVLTLGLPATVGLVVLSEPLLRVLFMHGEFSAHEVHMAARSLHVYSIGLVGFMMVKVLAPGYYARQDTKTPVRFGIIAMIANMVFNAILVYPLSYVGLALATALSGILNAGMLFWGLYRKDVYCPGRATAWFVLRLVFAAAVMGGALEYFSPPLEQWVHWSSWHSMMELSKLIGIGVVSYLLATLICGIRPVILKAMDEG
ncbi:murein biosynthesis integral membrane protein MurJ [Dongshaea marina]|uniref:murein biosynthesis integral membrane protein MurJ n=1 Tax=Dongshaea marina TaxID=2047966 RepID=UPI000D3E3FE7|nr:murein biosynthesis integral membrane protein MurJ [Dongshaea marina]